MPVKAFLEPETDDAPLYTRQYNQFRGVDFSTDPAKVRRDRSPYAQNVVSDSGGYPEKRPGWHVLHTIAGGKAVNGLHFFITSAGALVYVAHVGTKLYTWDETEMPPVEIYSAANDAKSTSFAYNGILYILDGANYLCYDGMTVAPVVGYVPTTVIGSPPTGGGTVFEAVNLLQPARKNSFIGNAGTAEVAQLQISTPAVASGNVTVTLGGTAYQVAILDTDTTAEIAQKIGAVAYTGWTAVVVGDTITFTADTPGEMSNALFDPGETGVLGNMITIIQGEPAATEFYLDAQNLDADVEIVVLRITHAATSGGNVIVTLGGVDVQIELVQDDTIASICTKIAAGVYAGWTAVADTDKVTFTATAPGAKADSAYDAGTTGAEGTMEVVAKGAAITAVVDGVLKTEGTDFTVDRAAGVVTFFTAPPSGRGVDNVVITFRKTIPGYADRIKKCTIAAWFGMGNDTRLFVSGNPDFPNMDWQSGLYDPTYFPDTGYTKVGADTSAIMGYLRQFDNLLVIKEDNEQDATIFKRTAELDSEGRPYFPLKQGVAGVGAVSKYAFGILRDDPLFFAKEGVFATTVGYGDVNQHRYAQERSYFVKPRLIEEKNPENAVAAVWKGLYILCLNSHCYVADSKQKTGGSSTETAGYEWYYWTNIPAVCFMVYGDKLYFGTNDGRICKFSDADSMYRYSDDGQPIEAIWSMIADDDGDFMRYKTMPKLGTGIMIKPFSKSSVKVYVRTEEHFDKLLKEAKTDVFSFANVDFSEFSFDTNTASAIIPLNVKVKKYRTLQIIVVNDSVNQGFGVYGIIKRYTLGGFAK